jgi:hypothetical protein
LNPNLDYTGKIVFKKTARKCKINYIFITDFNYDQNENINRYHEEKYIYCHRVEWCIKCCFNCTSRNVEGCKRSEEEREGKRTRDRAKGSIVGVEGEFVALTWWLKPASSTLAKRDVWQQNLIDSKRQCCDTSFVVNKWFVFCVDNFWFTCNILRRTNTKHVRIELEYIGL